MPAKLSTTELLKEGLRVLGFRYMGDTVKPIFERTIKRTGRVTRIVFLGGGWVEMVDDTLDRSLKLPVRDALDIVAKRARKLL